MSNNQQGCDEPGAHDKEKSFHSHVWTDDQPWPEKNIRRIQVDKWDTKFPTLQVTVADTGDAKTMFTFNRRLTDRLWKFPQPPKSGGANR